VKILHFNNDLMMRIDGDGKFWFTPVAIMFSAQYDTFQGAKLQELMDWY